MSLLKPKSQFLTSVHLHTPILTYIHNIENALVNNFNSFLEYYFIHTFLFWLLS